MKKSILRGDIYYADLGNPEGSVQGGIRPVLVIQNNVGNLFSPTLIVAPLSKEIDKNDMPTHCILKTNDIIGLKYDSVVLSEQIYTINKNQLKNKLAFVSEDLMYQVDKTVLVSLGIQFYSEYSHVQNKVDCA